MRAATAIILGVCVPLAACGSPGAGRAEDVPADLRDWSPDAAAFEPTRMRIHPLTRITRDADSNPVLACHLELRDASNQVVKCLGTARIEIDAGGGRPEGEARRWDVDLRDPTLNADAFDDLVTRTYALRLGDLPGSLERYADAPGGAGEGGGGAALAGVRVRAWFLFKDADGEVRELEAQRLLSDQ